MQNSHHNKFKSKKTLLLLDNSLNDDINIMDTDNNERIFQIIYDEQEQIIKEFAEKNNTIFIKKISIQSIIRYLF